MTTVAAVERRLPPGPRPRHPLGVLPWIRRDSLGFLRENFARYGDVTGYRLGPLRSALIAHPDGVRHVLQEHVKNYTKDHASYTMLRWIAGDGLLTSQGDSWLHQRRLAQPAFHRQRIGAMGEMMVRHSEVIRAEWEEAAAAGRGVDVGAAMMRLALKIVGDALFGARVDNQADTIGRSFTTLSEQLVARFRSGNPLPPVLPTRRDREWRQALAALDTLIYAMIAERRRSGEDHGDLFSMFLLARDEETGASMTDKHLRDELLTMLFAGHETTAIALTWTWALLDCNPAAAARLHAEFETVLGDRSPSVADLPQLTYTRMVIDESLRLYPPAWIMARGVKDDDSIGGYYIPKGSAVDISPYLIHRHPEFWPDPERFDPERFTPERQAARHKHAYIPFSTGPRICIGNSFALMEATLALATIARRVRPRLTGPMPEPDPLITLRPRGGLQMMPERR